jgi:hypothetical protein
MFENCVSSTESLYNPSLVDASNTFTDNLAIVGEYALSYMFYNQYNLKNPPTKINAHTIG